MKEWVKGCGNNLAVRDAQCSGDEILLCAMVQGAENEAQPCHVRLPVRLDSRCSDRPKKAHLLSNVSFHLCKWLPWRPRFPWASIIGP